MLEWQLKHGPGMAAYELAEKRGKVVKALEDQPELYPDLIPFWLAFQALNMTRRVGWQAEALSFTDILSWLVLHEVEQEEWFDYKRWVTFLDGIWMVWSRNRAKEEAKKRGRKR